MSVVALRWAGTQYSEDPPFDPETAYPEYPFGHSGGKPNRGYDSTRMALADLGLDRANFGKPCWNPLGRLAPLGGTVVIKPNLVVSEHSLGWDGLRATLASMGLVRPIVDYAFRAVGPTGRIVICDSPIKEVDFAKLAEVSGLTAMAAELRVRGVPVEVMDLRDLQATRDDTGTIVRTVSLPGDPAGYTVVDLGAESAFADLSDSECRRLRSTAAVYEDEASKHHSPRRNLYSLPNTILGADLVVTVAKLKTHRKSGMTGALKVVIGITNEKRWLPHHRIGTPTQGGDICPDDAPATTRLRESVTQRLNASRYGRLGYSVLKPAYRIAGSVRRAVLGIKDPRHNVGEGDWWGNDTIWRTTLDINVALRYADRAGNLRDTPQRSYLVLVDAMVCGDGEGPLHPRPKPVGAILLSDDPAAADAVGATLAGFDWRRIRTIAHAGRQSHWIGAADGYRLVVDGEVVNESKLPSFSFLPSQGWRDRIESIRWEAPN